MVLQPQVLVKTVVVIIDMEGYIKETEKRLRK